MMTRERYATVVRLKVLERVRKLHDEIAELARLEKLHWDRVDPLDPFFRTIRDCQIDVVMGPPGFRYQHSLEGDGY